MTTSSNPDGSVLLGKHRTWFEPPDVIASRIEGDMMLEDQLLFVSYAKTLPQPERGFFVLADISKTGRTDPAALKDPRILEYFNTLRCAVYYGTTFYNRTVIEIFRRIGKRFNIAWTQMPLHLFETEAEARAFIEKERRRG